MKTTTTTTDTRTETMRARAADLVRRENASHGAMLDAVEASRRGPSLVKPW